MHSEFHKNFFKILLTVILPIVLVVAVFSLYLFDRLIDEKKKFLLEKSATMSGLIANVASFDRKFSIEKDFNKQSSAATIFQIQNTFQTLDERVLKLEYVIGEISDGKINFIAYSGNQKPASIKVENASMHLPMRKALLGEKGVGIGFDYNNQKVFASYSPIEGTKWGLVIKQPYSSHMKPLYKTAWMSSLALLIFMVILYLILQRYDAKTRKEIAFSEHRYQQLVESSDDFIWEVDANGVYTYASKQCENLLGYKSQEMIGKTPFDFMSPQEAKRVAAGFIKILSREEKITNLENVNLHKDGHEVCLLTNGSPFYDDRGRLSGYRGIDRDITPLKQKQKEIEYLAFYDALTGLANRQNISERISQEINYTQRNHIESALLFLDLDDFKIINDTEGHAHGDEVLKVVSKRILKSIRSFDIAGRIGGDEFVVLVRGTNEDDESTLMHLDSLIARVVDEINKPINLGKNMYHVGVSIGVAILPKDGDTLEEILSNADDAMYEAKHLGKNRVVFHKKVI